MQQLSIKQRVLITLFFTVAVLAALLWEYTHGGVIKHYIFQNDQMPGISNWWGLLIIPVFTYVTSSLIKIDNKDDNHSIQYRNVILRGLILFIIGIVISYTFSINPESNIPTYITGALLVSSFFIRLYKVEYLLGYVLGTFFLFGAFIPVIAGSILWVLFYICYKTPRKISELFRIKRNN